MPEDQLAELPVSDNDLAAPTPQQIEKITYGELANFIRPLDLLVFKVMSFCILSLAGILEHDKDAYHALSGCRRARRLWRSGYLRSRDVR